jgi:rubrerythrin
VDRNLKPVYEKPSKFVTLLREQRGLELDHVKTLNNTRRGVTDRLASALLESITHDSRKHAVLCKALIDIEIGAVLPEMDVGDIIDVYQALEEYIKTEEEMIKRLESMLTKTLDGRTNAILRYLLADERRHHNTLKRMADLFSQSKIRFEEYLDLVEKYTHPVNKNMKNTQKS